MPSSKDPIINRQKANEYRLAHPEWKRRTGREWMRKKRAALGKDGRQAEARRRKTADPIGYLVEHARQRAIAKGISFDLTRDDLIMPEACPVLGLPFEWGTGQMGWRNMRSPSLDRIRPQEGYVKGNVQIISNRANHLKSNGTISELEAVLAYMRRVGANETLADQEIEPSPEAPSPQLSLGW